MIEEEYQRHWSHLKEAVSVMLHSPSGQPPNNKISFEATYSAVYKCVCDHQAERLHNDLMELVSGVLQDWRNHLESLDSNNTIVFLQQLDNFTVQYMQSLPFIVPIFAYMNRFYVVYKLCTDLQTLLINLYGNIIIDPIVEKVIGKYYTYKYALRFTGKK